MANDRNKEALDFVMGFVQMSEEYKEPFIPKWTEVVENFIVEPYNRRDTTTPQDPYRRRQPYQRGHGGILLKDNETHKVVMTYAAKLVKAALGDANREYVRAKPVGWEDAPQKAPTVTRLLRYAFSLPGHFRTMVEAVVDMLLFGTAIIEVPWRFEERTVPVREVVSTYGVETSTEHRLPVTRYDDVCLSVVDIQDFYPDPGEPRLENMSGACKKFKMTAHKARAMAEAGIYEKKAVERAIASAGKVKGRKTASEQDRFRAGRDQPEDRFSLSDFGEMIGYEYWGEVPWESDPRVLTILNAEVVRNDDWPLADTELPWKTLIINPTQGRFYGISPAEIIRYDQEFMDALKTLLAEAVVRSVHPPIAYDPDSGLDVAKLMRWKADLPVAVTGGPRSIGTLQYNANIGAAFGMSQGIKNSMQEGSGATGGIQGEPGPSREAASVGMARMSMAMERPELGAMLLENDALPSISRAILKRYQQFLEGTEDLSKRIGEMPEPYWIGDIMGDFDVEFVGSRMAMTRQQKLQAYDRLVNMAAVIPALQTMIPWQDIGREIVGRELELPDVAARMPDPQTMQMNAQIMQMFGGGQGAGANSVPGASEPPGLLPAQAAGGPIE